MEKTIVFLDAGYLDKISKYFGGRGNPIKFDINQFAITLAREQNLWCKEVYYYTATPYQSPTPTTEEKERRKNHDRFINALNQIPNFFVRQGRCQKKRAGKYHQKGVDSLIVMELITRLIKGDIKKIILLACDTDFVPILKKIRENYNIHVTLAFFCDYVRNSQFSMSNHILTECDSKVLIRKEHFDKSPRIKNKNNT